MNEDSQKHFLYIAVFILAAVSVLSVVGYFLWRGCGVLPGIPVYPGCTQKVIQRTVTDMMWHPKAARDIDTLADLRGTSLAADRAVQLVGESKSFWTGSLDGRLAAVRQAMDDYRAATTSPDKAYAINRVVSYFPAVPSKKMFDEVFYSDIFSEFRVGESQRQSLAALNEHSIRLQPTMAAYTKKALDEAELLYKDGVVDTGRIDKITALMAQAKTLFDAEQRMTFLTFQPLSAQHYHLKTGLTYGLLALVTRNTEYVQLSEEEYERALLLFETYRGDRGEYSPLLAVSVPYIHLYGAIVAQDVLGEKGQSLVKEHLDGFMTELARDTKLHDSYFTSHMRGLAQTATSESESLFTLREVAPLIAVEPRLKELWISAGLPTSGQ